MNAIQYVFCVVVGGAVVAHVAFAAYQIVTIRRRSEREAGETQPANDGPMFQMRPRVSAA